ncbi:taste receptor type 2 member 10-like, partial [Otolemur garnettii]|uniref:taste receptor type 2 member 10-like n=1 Tax=Otolemur garnettii TaxID=30611 RepID=UPI00064457D6
MLSVVEGIFLSVAIIESILGVLGNGFIALVYCIDCVRNKLTILGFILTGLAISRICLIGMIIIQGLMHILSPDIYYSINHFEYSSYMWLIINQSSVCFASSLSIFYFLKIANFPHYIFLWLKMRIGRILLLLMGFLLILLLIILPQVMKYFNDNKMKSRNTTWLFNMHKNELFIQNLWLNVGVIFFFTLSLIPCFLLIISLWRHNRKMQLNSTGFRD